MNYQQTNTNKHGWGKNKTSVFICVHLWIIIFALFLSGCAELEKPKTETFYADNKPPQKKEFRWSNGKMPKTFDPARASAPPETDIVRAIFEGLTDTNAKSLETIPAIAEKWEASEDFKTWTFNLRKDAKWSNGERVTAEDFVRSWKRLAKLGDAVSHRNLLKNIVGMETLADDSETNPSESLDEFLSPLIANQNSSFLRKQSNVNSVQDNPPQPSKQPEKQRVTEKKNEAEKTPKPQKIGVEAVDKYTFRVSLINPDKDFPALAAHPIFRPVYGEGKEFEGDKLNANIITNGAFRIASVGQDGITLDRAEHFWDKEKIELDRVRFVLQENAEKALEAYRAGEVDAVTNANFQPLALKLLKPYKDFRQTTHSALNFYEINLQKPPFDKREVREALAISIEREHLTEGEMEGATTPALSFLPFDTEKDKKLEQDPEKAQNLLSQAGFPNGENFPTIRLIVNRNNVQQRIANSIAKMWEDNLNIKTDVVVRESSEIETVRETGDFDILRRGVVLPTADETVGLMTIFSKTQKEKQNDTKNTNGETKENKPLPKTANTNTNIAENFEKEPPLTEESPTVSEHELILDANQAIEDVSAIPLYFPTSYSLVKPYIQGFEINTLDAHSLKNVKINNSWQPKKKNGES
jgi:oligopeptide transport system substrate-binding protein